MLDQLQRKKNIKSMQLRSPYSFFRTRILGIIQKISKFVAGSQVWCPVSIIEINKKSIIVVKNSSENKARRIFRKTNISDPLIRTLMYVCTSGGKKCSFVPLVLWCFQGVYNGNICQKWVKEKFSDTHRHSNSELSNILVQI